MTKQSTTINGGISDQVLSACLDLMRLTTTLATANGLKKAQAATLGSYFSELAFKHKDADIEAPLKGNESFTIPAYDKEVDQAEKVIKAKALSEGLATIGTNDKLEGFKLPRAWVQYRSNVRTYIGNHIGATDKKPIGIGKITVAITEAKKLEKAKSSPWIRSKYILRDILNSLEDRMSKASESSPLPTLHAAQAIVMNAIPYLLTETNIALDKMGLEPIKYATEPTAKPEPIMPAASAVTPPVEKAA